MIGDINAVVARELEGDRLRAAKRARTARASIAGPAAMRRQRARVQMSLLLVPRRTRSARSDVE